MSWIQVCATLPSVDDSSPFVEIFRDHGIESTQEEGALLFGCLVDVEGSSERVGQLCEALREAGVIEVSTRELEEQNWDEVWRQFFHPQRIGERIVVRPSWEEFESRPDDVVIVLDPGEAFGTGDHPTTRLCLRLLEVAVRPGMRVADVGCGSGILAIAACKLGAGEVEALDIDPTSVEVARANAARNGVTFSLSVGDGVADLKPPYDVVVSNIISAVLIGLAPQVALIVNPGGSWIVSGVLTDNWPLVLSAAQQAGFSLEEKIYEADWVAATFRR